MNNVLINNLVTMKKTNAVLSLILTAMVLLVSCDKEDIQIWQLSFEKGYYEYPLRGGHNSIMIRGGNRNYTIEVENPNILDAGIDLSSNIGFGDIWVNPKQKGETSITIHDNISKDTEVLKIKIVDAYLKFGIVASNHLLLTDKMFFYQVANENQECYFFDENYTLLTKGSSEYSVEKHNGENSLYLTLSYKVNSDGAFSMNDNAQLISEKYYINPSQSVFYDIIEHVIDISFEDLIADKSITKFSPVVVPVFEMKTKSNDTEITINGVLINDQSFPENIL